MLHLTHCPPLFLLALSFSFCYSMNWVSTRRPRKGGGGVGGGHLMRGGGKGKERKANKHRKGGEKGRADGEER